MENRTPSQYTFIVRLWQEWKKGESFLWRGSVGCVQGGERVYFQNIESLRETLACLIGESAQESEEEDKA